MKKIICSVFLFSCLFSTSSMAVNSQCINLFGYPAHVFWWTIPDESNYTYGEMETTIQSWATGSWERNQVFVLATANLPAAHYLENITTGGPPPPGAYVVIAFSYIWKIVFTPYIHAVTGPSDECDATVVI